MTNTPQTAEEWKNKGNEFFDKEDYQSALDCYNKASNLNKNDENTYYLIGYTYFKLNEYEKAIINFTYSINLNPIQYAAYVNRSVCHIELGKVKALNDYNKAIELFPNEPKLYINRAQILSTLGKYEEALKDYKHILEIKSHDNNISTYIYQDIATIYQQLNQPDKAAEYLKKAKELGYMEENEGK